MNSLQTNHRPIVLFSLFFFLMVLDLCLAQENGETDTGDSGILGVSGLGQLIFKNKDRIPVKIDISSSPSKGFGITSPLFSEAAQLNIPELDCLLFPATNIDVASNLDIHLTNGDHIKGIFHKFDKDKLYIRTKWAGQISIQRQMVDSLSFYESENILFDSTSPADTWIINSKFLPWEFEGNTFITDKQSLLGSHIASKEQLRISFTIRIPESGVFSLGFWTDSLEPDNLRNGYILSIQSDVATLLKKTNGGTVNMFNQILSQRERVRSAQNHSYMVTRRIDLFCNKEEKAFILYVDGKLAASYQGADPEQESTAQPSLLDLLKYSEEDSDEEGQNEEVKAGNGLYLYNRLSPAGYLTRITDLVVSEWNNVFPGPELYDIPKQLRMIGVSAVMEENESSHALSSPFISRNKSSLKIPNEYGTIVQLGNGDIMEAAIQDSENNMISSHSKNYSVDIPIDRIMGVQFVYKENEIKFQRMNKEDIRIQFSDSSTITVALKKSDPEKLQVYSEALGNLTLSIPYIRRITFNLYNTEFGKIRSDIYYDYNLLKLSR